MRVGMGCKAQLEQFAQRETQAMWATLPSFATRQTAQSRAQYARDGMLNRL